MFWDQMQRQIEHSGDSCNSEICTKSFGSQVLLSYIVTFITITSIFFPRDVEVFSLYFRNAFLHFQNLLQKALASVRPVSIQSQRNMSSKCSRSIQIKLCVFPSESSKPQIPTKSEGPTEEGASERLHLFLIQSDCLGH